jgi:HSP20 family protein
MAVLPARRSGTVARPGSQAADRWDPFGEFEDLYQRMGQLMDRAFDGLWQPSGQAPIADLTETGGAYVAVGELPGLRKDDVRVELAGQELVIGGEYRESGTEGRVMPPGRVDPDKITAALDGGVLTVSVPKAGTDKSRRIEITGGQPPPFADAGTGHARPMPGPFPPCGAADAEDWFHVGRQPWKNRA